MVFPCGACSHSPKHAASCESEWCVSSLSSPYAFGMNAPVEAHETAEVQILQDNGCMDWLYGRFIQRQ